MSIVEEYDELYGNEIKELYGLLERQRDMNTPEGKELYRENLLKATHLALKANDYLLKIVSDK